MPKKKKRDSPKGSVWNRGDVVRVMYHPHEKRAVGMIFTIETFSTMDFMGGHPTVENPWHNRNEGWKSPINLRFAPAWLTSADVLDRLAAIE